MSVIVKFNGGLGNQMFQWAYGRSLASKLNENLLFDMSFFNKNYSRPFQLEKVFGLKPEPVKNLKDKIKLELIWKFRKHLDNKNFLGINFYSEPCFEFCEEMLNVKPNAYIEGFFQTEKYFKNIEPTILKDFTFKCEQDENNKAIAKKILSTNSVSLHVRRGDYVQKKRYQDMFATCSLNYYRKAVEYISQQYPDIVLFVFSDDIKWVKENLNLPYEMVYVDFNTGEKSFEDMHLMSLCKHNIAANSSFSWWGAKLNANKDKIVIFPEKWFNDANVNQKDIAFESALRLPN